MTKKESLDGLNKGFAVDKEKMKCQRPDYIGIREMRKHAGWYLSGCRNASRLRGKMNEVETIQELEDLLLRANR